VLVDVVADGHDELFEVFEDAAAKLVLGQVAEEPFDHIEPTGRCWGEVDMEALVTVQPAGDLLVFRRGIVVADQVDVFFLGDSLVDQAEKLQPLLMPVPLLAEAEDLAVKGVQSCKQRCCAVAFIVMRHRLAASFLQWQPGLGSVQGLYLALLINVQNQRMLRRVQIQADDCFQLTAKLRITTYLKGLDQVRLESVRVPDASHAGLADTNFTRHGARGPMGRGGWSGVRGLLDHGVDHRCRNRRRAPRPGPTPSISAEVTAALIAKTTQSTPANATQWSTRTMAKEMSLSKASVSRIWRAHGLKPHRVESFKVSNDPNFADKLEAIVGLYLNPPEHALVLSVDEKSQIQALDRTQPGLALTLFSHHFSIRFPIHNPIHKMHSLTRLRWS
jgi:hypothetical protein